MPNINLKNNNSSFLIATHLFLVCLVNLGVLPMFIWSLFFSLVRAILLLKTVANAKALYEANPAFANLVETLRACSLFCVLFRFYISLAPSSDLGL